MIWILPMSDILVLQGICQKSTGVIKIPRCEYSILMRTRTLHSWTHVSLHPYQPPTVRAAEIFIECKLGDSLLLISLWMKIKLCYMLNIYLQFSFNKQDNLTSEYEANNQLVKSGFFFTIALNCSLNLMKTGYSTFSSIFGSM